MANQRRWTARKPREGKGRPRQDNRSAPDEKQERAEQARQDSSHREVPSDRGLGNTLCHTKVAAAGAWRS